MRNKVRHAARWAVSATIVGCWLTCFGDFTAEWNRNPHVNHSSEDLRTFTISIQDHIWIRWNTSYRKWPIFMICLWYMSIEGCCLITMVMINDEARFPLVQKAQLLSSPTSGTTSWIRCWIRRRLTSCYHHVTSTFGKSPFSYFWSGILHLGLKNIWIYDINRTSSFYGKQLLVILGMVKYVVSVSMDIRQIANVCCISCQCLRLQRWPWPWPVCVRVLPPAYPPVITRGS